MESLTDHQGATQYTLKSSEQLSGKNSRDDSMGRQGNTRWIKTALVTNARCKPVPQRHLLFGRVEMELRGGCGCCWLPNSNSEQ